ncbi:hypothetical protein DFH06DRAFT_1305481 [Mycena polygramma]|nr:hypothetical protein DFH06DRAFT_1305481 [Mycena polygramma]
MPTIREMATISETPLSIVAPALIKDIPVKPLAAITAVLAIPFGIYYASPARLTGILEDAMVEAKTLFDEAFYAGHVSRSQKRKFKTLKREVSAIKVETIRSSQSYWRSLWGFLKGRTFTVLLCIWRHVERDTTVPPCSTHRARWLPCIGFVGLELTGRRNSGRKRNENAHRTPTTKATASVASLATAFERTGAARVHLAPNAATVAAWLHPPEAASFALVVPFALNHWRSWRVGGGPATARVVSGTVAAATGANTWQSAGRRMAGQ